MLDVAGADAIKTWYAVLVERHRHRRYDGLRKTEMSSGGPADSWMAVWCRPLFPSNSNYSTPHAHERTECFGILPVVKRTTWREPTQLKRGTTPW
ncbi:uncharacterized protein TNCV_3333611 [Trichonephila clavipes]|nr:uncharacterized protein TNCV_3333611 [Trichonephila clavipes]